MTKTILFFTLIFQIGNIFGQFSQLTTTHIGPKIKSDRKIYKGMTLTNQINDFPGFYDTKERVLVMFEKGKKGFFITKHNEQGEKIGKSEIIPLPKNVNFIKIIDAGNGKKIMLYEEKIAKKQFRVWSRQYDLKTASFVSEAKLFDEGEDNILKYYNFRVIDDKIIKFLNLNIFFTNPLGRYATETINIPIFIHTSNGIEENFFKSRMIKTYF